MKKTFLILVLVFSKASAFECKDFEGFHLTGGDLPFPLTGEMDITRLEKVAVYEADDKKLSLYSVDPKRNVHFVIELQEGDIKTQGMAFMRDHLMEGVLNRPKTPVAFMFHQRGSVFKTENECFTLFQAESLDQTNRRE